MPVASKTETLVQAPEKEGVLLGPELEVVGPTRDVASGRAVSSREDERPGAIRRGIGRGLGALRSAQSAVSEKFRSAPAAVSAGQKLESSLVGLTHGIIRQLPDRDSRIVQFLEPGACRGASLRSSSLSQEPTDH